MNDGLGEVGTRLSVVIVPTHSCERNKGALDVIPVREVLVVFFAWDLLNDSRCYGLV